MFYSIKTPIPSQLNLLTLSNKKNPTTLFLQEN